MTNEALALAIQGGQDLYGELWEQTKRLIYQLVCSIYNKQRGACQRAGVELEDLLQCGFLALRDAVQAYDPKTGYKLLSFIQYPLKNHINALLGRRGKADPLNGSASLDEPIEGAEDLTLADSIEDDGAGEAFEGIIDREYNRELHKALFECLNSLDGQQRRCIVGRYFDGMTLAEIGVRENISPERARQLQAKSLRTLRRPEHTKRLKGFMDEIIESKAYQGTGFESWKAKGSVEERLVEYYEERERHYAMLAERGIALPGAFINPLINKMPELDRN